MLNALQGCLESIYGVEAGHRVEDFLVTDPAWLALFEPDRARAPATRERLLLHQEGDELGMSLYLDAEVVGWLRDTPPERWLAEARWAELCLAVEGVSHFLYLALRAASDCPVTQLELELQAEVDKYATIAGLAAREGRRRPPRGLREWLFGAPRFLESLSPQELERYRQANRYAARFCRQLERRFAQHYWSADMLAALRHFYRLGQGGKLAQIEAG